MERKLLTNMLLHAENQVIFHQFRTMVWNAHNNQKNKQLFYLEINWHFPTKLGIDFSLFLSYIRVRMLYPQGFQSKRMKLVGLAIHKDTFIELFVIIYSDS